MLKVPYNYLPQQFSDPSLIIADWIELIKSTDFTLGEYVVKFESIFADYVGAKYCIATNNGTDALILSLKSLRIGSGDEVITVCNSFYATTGAIVAVGAIPVFVDCDDRYQIDANKIESVITNKTKAIVPVHWGGASPDMKKIMQIANNYNLKVVEDACMGIGGKISNISPGNIGECGAYSMHPLKSLNVMGDGGMVTTNNSEIYSWMTKYRNHGMIDRDHIDFWGVNMRLQPLQAIVAMRCLPELDNIITIRNKNAEKMDKLLSIDELIPYVTPPKRCKSNVETHALYMGLFKNRDTLKEFLESNGIEVKIHYPIPLHLQKSAQVYGYKVGDFPVSEAQAKELLTIPIHQFVNEEMIDWIANCIKRFYLGQRN